ncbi:MAG: hypothetical protein OYL97_23085 [Candidatus Poribacteria bacterium]|nr:hypothetical protein [Candidatus Poribacteria bacterium]MDE0469942.1 hypothetical protein [Candidatus Poribacteria bacterium]
MLNRPTDAHIAKMIYPAIEVDISQDLVPRRTVASSLKTANKPLDFPLPSPALQISSNILHNTVSAVITVLVSSRPRLLRLTRSVSSLAIFGVALHNQTSIRLDTLDISMHRTFYGFTEPRLHL